MGMAEIQHKGDGKWELAPKVCRGAELAGDVDMLVKEFGLGAVRHALSMLEQLLLHQCGAEARAKVAVEYIQTKKGEEQ